MRNVRRLVDELREVFDVSLWDMTLKQENREGGAEIWIDLPYRRFGLTILSGFRSDSPQDQAKTLIHEFCHFFNVPLSNLLHEFRKGKAVSEYHQTDIMEYCNTQAEQVIYRIVFDNRLRNAVRRYVKDGGLSGKGHTRGG